MLRLRKHYKTIFFSAVVLTPLPSQAQSDFDAEMERLVNSAELTRAVEAIQKLEQQTVADLIHDH